MVGARATVPPMVCRDTVTYETHKEAKNNWKIASSKNTGPNKRRCSVVCSARATKEEQKEPPRSTLTAESRERLERATKEEQRRSPSSLGAVGSPGRRVGIGGKYVFGRVSISSGRKCSTKNTSEQQRCRAISFQSRRGGRA